LLLILLADHALLARRGPRSSAVQSTLLSTVNSGYYRCGSCRTRGGTIP